MSQSVAIATTELASLFHNSDHPFSYPTAAEADPNGERKEASTTNQPLQLIQVKFHAPIIFWSADTILKSGEPHFHLSREFDCWSKAKPGNFKSHGHWLTNLPIIDWCWLCYIRMVWLGRRWMRSSPSSGLLLLPEKNSWTSRCQSSLLPPPLQLRHTSSSFSCHSVFVTFLSFISFVTSSS